MSVQYLYRPPTQERANVHSEVDPLDGYENEIALPNVGDVVCYTLNGERPRLVCRFVEARTFFYLEDKIEVSITVTDVDADRMRKRIGRY